MDSQESILAIENMSGDELTREQLVQELDRWLAGDFSGNGSGGSITDIMKALKGGSDLGIFILGACFIDAMAGFRYGVTEANINDKHSKDRFMNFTREYLPEIYQNDKGRDFYVSMRCGLIHNHSERLGKYAFTSDRQVDHGSKTKNSKLILNRENFIEDLKEAYRKLRKDILNNEKEEVFTNAKARFISLGLMKVQIFTHET